MEALEQEIKGHNERLEALESGVKGLEQKVHKVDQTNERQDEMFRAVKEAEERMKERQDQYEKDMKLDVAQQVGGRIGELQTMIYQIKTQVNKRGADGDAASTIPSEQLDRLADLTERLGRLETLSRTATPMQSPLKGDPRLPATPSPSRARITLDQDTADAPAAPAAPARVLAESDIEAIVRRVLAEQSPPRRPSTPPAAIEGSEDGTLTARLAETSSAVGALATRQKEDEAGMAAFRETVTSRLQHDAEALERLSGRVAALEAAPAGDTAAQARPAARSGLARVVVRVLLVAAVQLLLMRLLATAVAPEEGAPVEEGSLAAMISKTAAAESDHSGAMSAILVGSGATAVFGGVMPLLRMMRAGHR
ncbi:unnamed protein product [Pedinophyceae sp. YPF-701]|nr:unnamed protein product [Pedinophyceae sp. YPF-701]